MSKSTSGFGKKSSLAKCYEYFENKKIKKRSRSSSVAGVEDKIEAAGGTLYTEPTTAAHEPSPLADSAVGRPQEAGNDPAALPDPGSADHFAESQQSGACAVTPSADQRKRDMAVILTDPDLLWQNFFSGVVMDQAADAIEANLEERKMAFAHSLEVTHAQKRSEYRFNDVCNLPLKLILTPLQRGRKLANAFASMLEMQFGPLHAALQVGNVVLEWNDSSLVSPHLCAYEDQVMELDMQPHSKWVEYTAQHHPRMRKAAQDMDYSQQIELTYRIASQKKTLIDALIGLIITYNKRHYYHVFYRNCQHFVLDALSVLEVSVPKELPGGLGEYYQALVKGKTPSVPSKYRTHYQLDEYVVRKKREKMLDSMPQHDLEFLLVLYFRFHLEKKSKLKDNRRALEAWQCGEMQCCMEEVERLIQIESMKIHSFAH